MNAGLAKPIPYHLVYCMAVICLRANASLQRGA
jgi:hypothetical protein